MIHQVFLKLFFMEKNTPESTYLAYVLSNTLWLQMNVFSVTEIFWYHTARLKPILWIYFFPALSLQAGVNHISLLTTVLDLKRGHYLSELCWRIRSLCCKPVTWPFTAHVLLSSLYKEELPKNSIAHSLEMILLFTKCFRARKASQSKLVVPCFSSYCYVNLLFFREKLSRRKNLNGCRMCHRKKH